MPSYFIRLLTIYTCFFGLLSVGCAHNMKLFDEEPTKASVEQPQKRNTTTYSGMTMSASEADLTPVADTVSTNSTAIKYSDLPLLLQLLVWIVPVLIVGLLILLALNYDQLRAIRAREQKQTV